MSGAKTYQLRICSLFLLALLTGYCRSQANMQPEVCTKHKPKNSDCPPKQIERRWFFHPTKGCKKSGFCKVDALEYDDQTGINYFSSKEVCQETCMSYITCPVLEPIANGSISNNGTGSWGTSVRYSCDESYNLIGSSVRWCRSNGTWSGTIPTCNLKCPLPSLAGFPNMRFAPVQEFYKQGDEIFYECTKPYMGHSSRICEDDGSWSGTEPVCELSIQCPEPGLVEHAKVHTPSRTVGSTHIYTCDQGFMMYGNATRECGSSGEWIGEKPICWKFTIEQCDELNHPQGNDVTNQNVKLHIGERNIWFNTKISTPNPFTSEMPSWRFENVESFPRGIEISGPNMKITAVLQSMEQEGKYTVSIGDFEAFFTLLIAEKPATTVLPSLLLTPNDVKTNVGNSTELTCIFEGCPKPIITWYHNGVLVNDNRRIYEEQNVLRSQNCSLTICYLKISQVVETDAGTYYCIGSNEGGRSRSHPAQVKVTDSSSKERRSIPSRASRSRLRKRSLEAPEEPLCSSKASPDTFTIAGRVKREMTRLRAPGYTEYRLHVNRVLQGPTDRAIDISQRNLRTIVIDYENSENSDRLKRNEQYILQGRVQDNTLLVYRHDSILEHTTALEEKLQRC